MQYFIYCTSKIIYILPVCNYFPFKTTMYKLGPTLRTYDLIEDLLNSCDEKNNFEKFHNCPSCTCMHSSLQ